MATGLSAQQHLILLQFFTSQGKYTSWAFGGARYVLRIYVPAVSEWNLVFDFIKRPISLLPGPVKSENGSPYTIYLSI